MPVKEAVAQEVAYLEKADQIVDGYLKALGPRVSELNDSEKKGAHFAAIQAEFVKAFPDYAFPDMVGYSVYGLVQHKLTSH